MEIEGINVGLLKADKLAFVLINLINWYVYIDFHYTDN